MGTNSVVIDITFTVGSKTAGKEKMKIEYWYDRHARSWVVMQVDEEGNQIGEAEYCGTKEERDYIIKNYYKGEKK